MVPNALLQIVREQFALDWYGVHGVRHWARVRLYGLRLAALTGADPDVVEHFAFLHDSCRLHDHADDEHGARAAAFVAQLPERLLRLSRCRRDQLLKAIAGHTTGRAPIDVTVATCWDADRLDMGRLSRRPDPAFLFNDAAKAPDFIEYCWRRSRTRHPVAQQPLPSSFSAKCTK